MSDLQSLARQKAEAQMQQRLKKLPSDIKALHNRLSAEGGVRSGNMLKKVLSLCQQALAEQNATVISEYRWAVTQALLASQTWVERLIEDASQSIEPLNEACIKHVKAAVALAGIERVEARLLEELAETKAALASDLALALRSSFAERRRGLVRFVPAFIGRLTTKLLGGGHA